MPLTGLDKMKKLSDAALALTKVPSRVAKAAAEGIEEAIDVQFNAGVDPFGTPWAPLSESTKRKGRRNPPLTDTGDMRNAHVAARSGAGLSVEFGRPDAAEKHQKGLNGLPVRQIWPENAAQLKKSSWGRAVVEAYAETVLSTPELKAAGAALPSKGSLTSE